MAVTVDAGVLPRHPWGDLQDPGFAVAVTDLSAAIPAVLAAAHRVLWIDEAGVEHSAATDSTDRPTDTVSWVSPIYRAAGENTLVFWADASGCLTQPMADAMLAALVEELDRCATDAHISEPGELRGLDTWEIVARLW